MFIGLTTTPTLSKSAERVNVEYIRCVEAAGGIPVLIPPPGADCDLEQVLDAWFGVLRGIILTGGEDIDPSYYGESIAPEVVDINHVRDKFEIALTRRAYDMDFPVFGICRGLQLINVALGGNLYQDIKASGLSLKNHNRGKPYGHLSHSVTLAPKSRLAAIINGSQGANNSPYQVNSLHHQAIKEVAPVLQINAITEDGVIEGLEDPAKSFFLGVQWHPEYVPRDQILFDSFCHAAAHS